MSSIYVLGAVMIGASVFTAFAGSYWGDRFARRRSFPVAVGVTLAVVVAVISLWVMGFLLVEDQLDPFLRILLLLAIWFFTSYATYQGAAAARQVRTPKQSQ